MNITISSLMRSLLPLAVLLLTACLSGSGGAGSSPPKPAATGANSVVYAVNKSAPIATCPNGGITVQSGIDTNGNGVLDPSEVTSTQYVCNGAGITWVDVADTSIQAVANTGYMADNAAPVTITLPASPAVGDVFQVNGVGAGGWTIATNPTQWIETQYISASPLVGTISGLQYESITLQYIGNNIFAVLNYVGTNPTTLVTLPAGYVSEGGLTWSPISGTQYSQDPAFGNPANTYCTTSTINGLTGWRLPTSAELRALYGSISTSVAVYDAVYGQGWAVGQTWTSTPYSAGTHYYVDLLHGANYQLSDTTLLYVTCVR